MNSIDLEKEIEELEKNLIIDEAAIGEKAHNLRKQAEAFREQAKSCEEQANRVERHFDVTIECIRMKKKKLHYKRIQEQQHNELLEG